MVLAARPTWASPDQGGQGPGLAAQGAYELATGGVALQEGAGEDLSDEVCVVVVMRPRCQGAAPA
jgi:hypothetical protein